MSVNVTFHPRSERAPRIAAIAGTTMDFPLRLVISEADGKKLGEVTVYTNDLRLAAKLAEAINSVQETHREAVGSPVTQEELDAADEYMKKLEPAG